jgi:hypothetical protein
MASRERTSLFGSMTTNHSEKSDVGVSVTRRVHRFLTRHFSKLRGIGGGAIIGLWLFGGIILAFGGQDGLRILGFVLLLVFVGNYIFQAYWYADDKAELDGAANRSQPVASEETPVPPAAGSGG